MHYRLPVDAAIPEKQSRLMFMARPGRHVFIKAADSFHNTAIEISMMIITVFYRQLHDKGSALPLFAPGAYLTAVVGDYPVADA